MCLLFFFWRWCGIGRGWGGVVGRGGVCGRGSSFGVELVPLHPPPPPLLPGASDARSTPAPSPIQPTLLMPPPPLPSSDLSSPLAAAWGLILAATSTCLVSPPPPRPLLFLNSIFFIYLAHQFFLKKFIVIIMLVYIFRIGWKFFFPYCGLLLLFIEFIFILFYVNLLHSAHQTPLKKKIIVVHVSTLHGALLLLFISAQTLWSYWNSCLCWAQLTFL